MATDGLSHPHLESSKAKNPSCLSLHLSSHQIHVLPASLSALQCSVLQSFHASLEVSISAVPSVIGMNLQHEHKTSEGHSAATSAELYINQLDSLSRVSGLPS